jgi:hypothetical protein
MAGKASENSIIPTLYDPSSNSVINQKFRTDYQRQYNVMPDYNAAQGYDSVMLLAKAIELAGSTVPSVLTSTLHYMPAWIGVTGLHSFDKNGEIHGKKYLFLAQKEGQWHYLPALHVPHYLARFVQSQVEKYGDQYKISDYRNVFKQKMHEDDRKTYLVDLAHEILQFESIGLIYEDTLEGRKASEYTIVKSVADRKKFKLISCKIPFSILKPKQIKQKIIACYGKLPLHANAIYVSPMHVVDKHFMQTLNKNLSFFKTPTISLNHQEVIDPYITLSIDKRQDITSRSLNDMAIYNNLLAGLKVHEFSEQLSELPGIRVNLKQIQQYGLSEKAIITLSPDSLH